MHSPSQRIVCGQQKTVNSQISILSLPGNTQSRKNKRTQTSQTNLKNSAEQRRRECHKQGKLTSVQLGSCSHTHKAMATHSSTLAWKMPWTEEPGRLQSMGSLRVRHDWATSLSLFLSCIGEGNGNPLQCSCLENPRDRGAWWAAVYGVAQSRTRLKRFSSSNIYVLIFYTHCSIEDKIL